jgi:hybrid polyketide synthase/nonribosomal peptide synthetase ACE1
VLEELTSELEHHHSFLKLMSGVSTMLCRKLSLIYNTAKQQECLLSYSPTNHYFALATHHIIIDQASTDSLCLTLLAFTETNMTI